MAFYNEKVSIVTDKLNNIYFFQIIDGEIIKYYFDNFDRRVRRNKIAVDALEEYDVAVGKNGYIYLIYQNNNKDLILMTIYEEKINSIRLTKKTIPYVYNLAITLDKEEIHIFYNILLDEKDKKYRLYHHHYDKYDWYTNVIDEIKVLKVLDFFNVENYKDKITIIYYNFSQSEQAKNIYIKKYNSKGKKWSDKIKITANSSKKLYLDTLLKGNVLHLAYSQFIEENLAIKYEKYSIFEETITTEKEIVMSNVENCSYPTFIYFDERLWLVWLEYENILSRYSEDNGETWSSIYLWNEAKKNDILRYKYCAYASKDNRKNLKYSFGKIYPSISFIGFGPLENVVKVPLKKIKR